MNRPSKQEVCPWNRGKFVQITGQPDFSSSWTPEGVRPGSAPSTDAASLISLMGMDEAEWDRFSEGRAVRRAKRAGFLRNVAVALGNWGSPEAVPALVSALEDEEPLVRGHAAWALERIGTEEASAALKARLEVEEDGGVREEIARALGAEAPWWSDGTVVLPPPSDGPMRTPQGDRS